MLYEQIEVVSYCGYRSNERPISFSFQDIDWQVTDIIERWHEASIRAGAPTHSYFKVITHKGNQFILRLNNRYKTWAIRVG